MVALAGLVEAGWLKLNLHDPSVKILDGTWTMPDSEESLPDGFIPGSRFFDIDEIAAPHENLRHMLPSGAQFKAAMETIGIANSDHVICYDRHGVFSSPRLWWTFKMFGHEKISILNGGLPAWIAEDGAVDLNPALWPASTPYVIGIGLSGVVDFNHVLSDYENCQIVDARPEGRFNGSDPEPRAGLKSGHIPGSQSLPFSVLIENGKFKPIEQLKKMVASLPIDLKKPIITTCGSGITAAGVAFVLHGLGAEDVRVYDGSWCEWGETDAPVEVYK